MTRRYFSSTAQRTTLANPLSNSATTMIVSSVSGFPGTRPYTLILDLDTVNEEIVTVTAASGTTLTVLRGEDGTTAVAHDLGSSVVHGFTGRDLGEPQAHMDTTDGVHGVTGDVVGTEGVQTIQDKNLDGIDNTFTNIPQSAVTDLVTDLGLKAPKASPTFTGTVVLPGTTSIGDVDATEIGYVNGATSNIQTQLDAKASQVDMDAAEALIATKADINSPTFTGTVTLPSSTSIGGVTADEIAYLDGVTSSVQTQINTVAASIGTPTYRYGVQTYFQQGELAVTTGTARFRFPFNATILGVSLASGTAPTGTGPGIIVDVNINGTTIFTDQNERPQIALTLQDNDESDSTIDPADAAVAVGDYMTVDIDSVGSTLPGDDLTVIIRYSY